MTVKIELGFTADGVGAPFFRLDDPVLGILDNPNAFLGGGELFVDTSAYFKSFGLARGKSRELDRYQAGQASVTFDNSTRVFDPTYEASPFFGQIVPKRQIRITVDNVIQYLGVVEDWNIVYEPGNNSEATCQAFDSFSYFANVELGTATYPAESTAQRLNNLLDSVGWAPSQRDFDTTLATLAEQTIVEDTNALPIMQTVAASEPADLFIAKNGDVKLVGRNTPFESNGVVFSDAGTAIPYKTINAIYGSELLYNTAAISSSAGTATAVDESSINEYGERALTQTTYLSSTTQLEQLAEYLVVKYGQPEYRFENLTIDLLAIGTANRAAILGIELGDIVQINFTPSNLPPVISRYGKIIGLSLGFSPNAQEASLQLQSTQGALMVLDDPVFGKLDSNNVLGW
jgi:hypothetical protein